MGWPAVARVWLPADLLRQEPPHARSPVVTPGKSGSVGSAPGGAPLVLVDGRVELQRPSKLVPRRPTGIQVQSFRPWRPEVIGTPTHVEEQAHRAHVAAQVAACVAAE